MRRRAPPPACMPASSIRQLQHDQSHDGRARRGRRRSFAKLRVAPSSAEGRLAARPCGGRVRHTGRRAKRRRDLLPQPDDRRRCGSRGHGAPDRDVPRGPSGRRRLHPHRAGRREGAEASRRNGCGAKSRSHGHWPELVGFGAAIALRDRISASPELVDTIGPAVGLLLRERLVRQAAPERVA
jgi:hypothetical protein